MNVWAVVPTIGAAPLERCLDALRAQSVPCQVLVVDDGAREPIAPRCGDAWVVRLERGRGFAPAAALGLERAWLFGADALLLVNDDVVLAPDALERLLGALDDPRVAAAGPLLAREDEPSRADGFGIELDRLGCGRDRGAGRALEEVAQLDDAPDALTGAALLLRAAAYREVGGLDPGYRFYYEDVDLCLRLVARGWRLRAVASARGTHVHSATIGPGSPRQAFHLARSRLRFLRSRPAAALRVPLIAARLVAGAALDLTFARPHVAAARASGVIAGLLA